MKKILLIIMIPLSFILGCSKEFYVDTEKEGSAIPNFKLVNMEGKKINSDSIFNNGKNTLFVMAAEWCPHCKEESPEIQRFYDDFKEQVNVVVVFSNSNSNLEKVKEYISKNGYTYPVYYDADGSILRGFKINAFPFNLKIHNGKVVKELELPLNYEKMVSEMTK